ETLEAEPALSPEIAGGSYSPLDSVVNPLLLNLGFLNSAKSRGARVYTGVDVTGVGIKHGKVREVLTSKGKIQTPLIINATGAVAADLAAKAGCPLPIKPRRGQILVTESVPTLLRHSLLAAKYIAAKYNPEIGKTEGMGFAIEQTANGNILIGSTREFVGFDKRTTWQGIQTMARNIIRVIPALKDLFVIRAFAGLRPYTPDGLPILGPLPHVKGFIMAAGHEGDGIFLAPITGFILAEYIANGQAPYSLETFRPDRFEEA
ncbi:MAG: FAD-binding oxidoreductase, partial [Deltaproteobacteria bacterium]|nr:FAD-binding oxidoreductase [Deltaproteobacteria bacterium]